ncbi:MAG: TetR/AcrR family transcriptional regulator [Gemmatimonadetes bacterium]|nr:TetR/AcrR family transcriptional regulator [Gemmatimonadota bacterium]MCC6773033.1 TetR/AcrR family transcriptional regulator [Gemmatimonadaceae bacterium]
MVKPASSRAPAAVRRRPVAATAAGTDGASRDRILAAAHRVFRRQGTSKTRTQEIADEAGVNKALVHYYFGTKEALADAVFAAAAAEFLPTVFAILGDAELSIEDKVRAVVREQLDFHGAHPYLAGYVVSEAHTQPERVQTIMRRAGTAPLGVLRRQLAAAAAAGEIRRISAEHFVANLMGLLVFPFVARPLFEVIVGLDADRFPAFVEARKRELPAFFLAGLRP